MTLSLRGNPMGLHPSTRVSVASGSLTGHTGTVIRDDNHEQPGRVPCDLVWVLLDAGDNPQRFRRGALEAV